MTTQELIDYYADLLILQYRGKPNAYATIQTLVGPMIMDRLPLLVQAAFAIDTAVGVQLDVLGKYAGVQRRNQTFNSLVVLSDDDFRLLIKVKVIQNNSGSSLKDIQALLFTFFPGTLLVFDNQDMALSYFFNSSGSAELAEVFVRNDFLPRPMGVQLGSLIYIPSLVDSFTFRTYDSPATNRQGFNDYASYQTDWPWLTYADVISF